MGICTNCIYIGDKIEEKEKKPHGRFCYKYTRNGHRMHCIPDTFGPDYKCLNTKNSLVDFVTGEEKLGPCRLFNGFGECQYFDDGSVDFYAWKKDDYTVYTLSENPAADDEYYNKDGDKLGTLTNIAALYAWVKDDVTIYTLTATPFENYTVYDKTGTEQGTISSINEDVITVDSVEYTRTAESNISNAAVMLDSDFYFRDEADDTKIIIEEE